MMAHEAGPGEERAPESYRDRLEELVHSRTAELVREVEERRRVQRALQDSEARFHHLFSTSRDALSVYPLADDGTPGKFIEVNDVACQLLGYEREELLQMTPADVILPGADGREMPARLKELLEKGHVLFQWEHVARDGSRIPAESSLQILELNGQRMVLSATRDITDRLRIQQDLQMIVEGTLGLTGRSFFRAIVQQVAQILEVRCALVAELEPSGSLARTLAFWDNGDWAGDFEFPMAGTPCQYRPGRQECFFASGVRACFPQDETLARMGAEGYHAISLNDASGEMMGLLAIMHPEPLPDDVRSASILSLFAARAAAELERMSAEAALRRHAREQTALYAVASTLNSSLDPDNLLARILDVLLPVTGADAGWIALPATSPTDPPRAAAWKGLPNEDVAGAIAMPLSECLACAPHLQSTAAVMPRVVVQCPHLPRAVLERSGLQYQACVPLTARGRVLGTLGLAWKDEHQVGKQEEALLLALGYQTALGLHHAQLYQQARQVDQLRILGVLDREMAATLDPKRVAEITLEGLAQALNASDAVLLPYTAGLGSYPQQVLTLAEGWCDLGRSDHYAGWRPFLETLPALAQTDAEAADEEKEGGSPREVLRTRAFVDTVQDGSAVLVVPVTDGRPMAHLVLAGHAFGVEEQLLAQAAAGRAAQALRNAQLYAEVRALLREREETQAQLVHSEKMSALGRLAASIAHEINNPIQAVQGCLGLAAEELEGEGSPEVLARYVSIAREEVKRIGSILHRMRDFYQPAGESMDNTDVREVLEDVLALMARTLAHRDVEVERAWADEVPTIQANANQLKQVFLNMVLNAADAMPQGGKLRICVQSGGAQHGSDWPQSPNGSWFQAVRIEFQDEGTGIPDELQPHLFEPFFTTKKGGSGLGLYISYGIIRAHHGRIVVGSHEGEGTTFTILLPASRPAGAPAGGRPAGGRPANGRPTNGRPTNGQESC